MADYFALDVDTRDDVGNPNTPTATNFLELGLEVVPVFVVYQYLPAETVLVLVLHRALFSVAPFFGPFALLPPFPNPVLGLSFQCHWTHLSL